MGGSRSFLLATLAMNQTVFFEALGAALEALGHRVAYLCFHERSHEYLEGRARRSFNAFNRVTRSRAVEMSGYAWPSMNLVLSHEKAAFEVYDSRRLAEKLAGHLAASESALDELHGPGEAAPILVQELGGFLSNMASHYAARRRGLHSIFMEPSFFAGRMFFTRDGFGAPRVPGPRSGAVSAEVLTYLDDAVSRQKVVIPLKDAHHYRGPLRKLADARHVRRLIEKTLDKHVLGKGEEFSHIGGHVARHARMLVNSQLLRRYHRPMPPESKRFIYYPLHVPADVALTIRSPQYVDQLALVDFLARCVPETHDVVIKEHPALVGAVDRRRLIDLLHRRDNVHLLDPRLNNYQVMQQAGAVVTVNSKSGAEALLLGRPVLVLGDAFYADCQLVRRVASLDQLPGQLADVLGSDAFPDPAAVRRYFQDVWDASWPGELHVAASDNARCIAGSLVAYLEREAA